MGALLEAVKLQQAARKQRVNPTEEMKRNFVIERLLEMKINKTPTGKSIYECDYEELKYELVLASFRQTDIQVEESKWF